MHQGDLDKLYNEAKYEKLIQMYDLSVKHKKDSDELEELSLSIEKNLMKSIQHRLGKGQSIDDFSNMFVQQFNDMNKQWQILSAAMVNVKRSINVGGFCNVYDKLCVNPAYGFKGFKKFSSWSPFNRINTYKFLSNGTLPVFDSFITF